MSRPNKIIGYICITAIACSLPLLAASAQDSTLSDSKVQQIKDQCLSIKATLNQLHSSDALLRVNRGQIYESMLTKLMDKFNTRLISNKYDADNLKNIASEYSTMLDTFRLDYQAYEEQLATTMDIDCSSKPVKFYDSVLSARTKRSLVHADVIKLNAQLAKYQEALDVFSSSFNTNNSEAKQ